MSVVTDDDQEQLIDLRCPYGPKQLLAKVVKDGDYRGMAPDGLTFELVCRDCTKRAKADDPGLIRVVHRFNVLGELVESIARRVNR